MEYLIVALISYLIGCSHMSFYIEKLSKVDIKKQGSKNYGASNTVMLLGWKAGVLVGAHDILKGFFAVLLVRYFWPDLEYATAVAGVACVLGHIFPFYLKFDGGKGFATYVGMMVALNWKMGLIVVVLLLLIAWITDYIVSGTLTTITLTPLYYLWKQSYIVMGILLIASLIILYKHRSNLVKMANGTETRIRKAGKGEYRAK